MKKYMLTLCSLFVSAGFIASAQAGGLEPTSNMNNMSGSTTSQNIGGGAAYTSGYQAADDNKRFNIGVGYSTTNSAFLVTGEMKVANFGGSNVYVTADFVPTVVPKNLKAAKTGDKDTGKARSYSFGVAGKMPVSDSAFLYVKGGYRNYDVKKYEAGTTKVDTKENKSKGALVAAVGVGMRFGGGLEAIVQYEKFFNGDDTPTKDLKNSLYVTVSKSF